MSVCGLPSDTKPTIKQLLVLETKSGGSIDIKTELAADWKKFGFYFDFDRKGCTLDLIEAEREGGDPVVCYQKMMRKWMDGSGEQPASWRTFLKLLRQFGRNVLAQDIEDAVAQD